MNSGIVVKDGQADIYELRKEHGGEKVHFRNKKHDMFALCGKPLERNSRAVVNKAASEQVCESCFEQALCLHVAETQ